MAYCVSRFRTIRRRTVEVKIGAVGVGGAIFGARAEIPGGVDVHALVPVDCLRQRRTRAVLLSARAAAVACGCRRSEESFSYDARRRYFLSAGNGLALLTDGHTAFL